MGYLQKDSAGESIQTFTPAEGGCNLTSGTHSGSIIRCADDGSVTYTYASTATDTIAMSAGDDYGIPAGATVTITSGTFHIN